MRHAFSILVLVDRRDGIQHSAATGRVDETTARQDSIEDRTLLLVDDAEGSVDLIASLINELTYVDSSRPHSHRVSGSWPWFDQLRQELRIDPEGCSHPA